MPATTAANLLALIGIFDIVGTIASGWLSDRVDPRFLLFVYYLLRGLSLLVVPSLLGPEVHPNLFLFIVFYGLDWVATVPPTVALCRTHFGLERSGVVFGWVFASHMVGAGVAASYAGLVREHLGDYYLAWMTAGGLCLIGLADVPLDPGAGAGGRRVGARVHGRGDGADLGCAALGQPVPQLGLPVQASAVTLAALGGDGGEELLRVACPAAVAARRTTGCGRRVSTSQGPRRRGSGRCRRPRSCRIETARPSGSGAMSAACGPVRELRGHRHRCGSTQPDLVADDVRAGD